MVNGQAPAVWSTTLHQCWRDSLEHAVAAVPLHGGGRDPLGYTRHQVLLPGEVVVRQVFNLSGNYRHRRYYVLLPFQNVFFFKKKNKETCNIKGCGVDLNLKEPQFPSLDWCICMRSNNGNVVFHRDASKHQMMMSWLFCYHHR